MPIFIIMWIFFFFFCLFLFYSLFSYSLLSIFQSWIPFPNNTINTLNFDGGDGGNDFYGKVKDLKVYNTALSDNELIALTTI